MSSCCNGLDDKFGLAYVEQATASRQKKGPSPTTTKLIELLSSRDVRGASLLDIGAGFGDLQAALFARGVANATHVEASVAYSAAAREVARRGGFEDRVSFEVGDFVELSEELPEADIVALDRVVCCYPDMPEMIGRSVSKARLLYAISAPRSRLLSRVAFGVENLVRWLKKEPFRTYVHSWDGMDARLRAAGFAQIGETTSPVWRMALYGRTQASDLGPGTDGRE